MNLKTYQANTMAEVLAQLRKDLGREAVILNTRTVKKGGFLVFDHTEALTVIDVNSGGYVGKSNQDETILNTNIESAIEIARQLRLRDIGGIIVIDFIDMHNLDHRRRRKPRTRPRPIPTRAG